MKLNYLLCPRFLAEFIEGGGTELDYRSIGNSSSFTAGLSLDFPDLNLVIYPLFLLEGDNEGKGLSEFLGPVTVIVNLFFSLTSTLKS